MKETNQPLGGRTVLIPPDDLDTRELTSALMRDGARVITWPEIEIVEPESFALDEAIQNLFGYDWLILANPNAADFFLRRLQTLGHEISELDPLRVCAANDATRQQLEEAHVHVDLVPEAFAAEGAMTALETFVGGRESLCGLNFLLPRAAISRDSLQQTLEDAGARVDLASAYRTAGPHNSELVQLGVLLDGGGIDCVVFNSPGDLRALSQLFDTNDVSRLLKGVVVACADQATAQVAVEFGLRPEITPAHAAIPELAHAIAAYFSTSHTRPA